MAPMCAWGREGDGGGREERRSEGDGKRKGGRERDVVERESIIIKLKNS